MVKTSSGARAVQIVHSSRKGSRDIEHIGSAHEHVELELLKTVARQRLAAGQGELDLGMDVPPEAGGPLPITAARMGHLWDALSLAYDVLGFDAAAGGDEVFRQLVLARIVEPTSKLDSVRVLEEVGVPAASYPTMNRRLRVYSTEGWRESLAAACARQVDPRSSRHRHDRAVGPGRPGALLRPAPLRTGRARFPASGSSKPREDPLT
jgi:hypothetical protein